MLSAATRPRRPPAAVDPGLSASVSKSCRVGCEAEFCWCTTYFDHRSRLPWGMDVQAHEDVAAAAAAHSELGHEYEAALAEGLIERISSEIDKQVDTRLAQRGIRPTGSAWANVAMGLGSVGLGIGATAVTLHSLSSTGTVPKATVVLGPFHASVMSSTTSISTAQVVLVVLIWVVIAVVNIAYARRRLGSS